MRKPFSHTSITAYMECGRAYYLGYLMTPKPPKRTDLPRLFGVFLHQHVQRMHQKTADGRLHYYQTLASAIKAGYHFWYKALEENKPYLVPCTQAEIDKYTGLVPICIAQYWKYSVKRPRPLKVEWRIRAPWGNGIDLVGVIDQVRPIAVDDIARLRPELVVDGVLDPEFDPVILVDLKTGGESYAPWVRGGETANLRQWVTKQAPLHKYKQPTIYTWLYRAATGKWPIGFAWLHVRSATAFITYRTQRHIDELNLAIRYVAMNLDAQMFPRNEGSRCARCDFVELCDEGKIWVSYPSDPLTPVMEVTVPVAKTRVRQRRLPLKVERRKAPLPETPGAEGGTQVITIGDAPWLDETA